MVDVFTGLSAFKASLDIAKGLKDIDDATRRNAAVIELQEKLLSAYHTHTALVERVSELEKEVARLKAWEADKERYELKALAPGVVAYSLKPAMSNGEPPHYLCANCCARGEKSHLQQHLNISTVERFKCNVCGEELHINKPASRTHHDREDGGNSWMTY